MRGWIAGVGVVSVNAVKSDDLRSQNRSRVLEVVRRQGVTSRTDIGSTTGLSPATISAITADFLEEGVLLPARADGAAAGGRGRPQVALELNPAVAVVGGVHFHFNGVSVVIADYAGDCGEEFFTAMPTHELDAQELRSALCDCIEAALQQSSLDASKLCRLAVGVQGVIDADGTCVLWSPITAHRDLPVSDWMESHFGVPTRISNDCDLIARALHWRDSATLGNNFAAVLLDHGVGMGLFLQNAIVNGTHSSGIEFGHMTYQPDGALCRCGNRGCIEAYAGDYAISRRAGAQSEQMPPSDAIDNADLERVLVAAENGNADAIAAIDVAGAAIGTGLASLFALVDCFPVVLIGGGTIFFERMQTSLRRSLENSPTFNEKRPIEISCYPQVSELVLQGGTISALKLHDQHIANNRQLTESAF